jgi:hypothetical protein
MKHAANLAGIGVSALLLACCGQPSAESATDTALRARFAPNEFHVVWTMGAQAHPETCGLVRLGSDGHHPPSPDTLFIVVDGRAYTPHDVLPEQFLRWGKEFCGPDWVAPNYIIPIS